MKKLIALTMLSLTASMANPFEAQAKFPGILQRYQLGYTFVFATADYKAQDNFPGIIDTSYTISNLKTKAAFGVTLGTYIPLKRLGRMSSMVLGIDYLYNAMLWESTVPRYGIGGLNSSFDFSGATVQMALPIGLDFKWGADAINVKNHRFCATLGLGAYPSYSLTTLDEDVDIDPQFSIAPYAKFEVGVFAGICMKLRALCAFGEFKYMDVKSGDETMGQSSTQLTGKANINLSLLIMPFSFTWKRDEWFNTF